MELRHYAEVSPLHLEKETWERLVNVMEWGPSSPRCGVYDLENPWHQLIGDPMRYGCWLWTDFDRSLLTDLSDQLPASLLTILDDVRAAGAAYVLFDADLLPMGDWPVFDHDDASAPAPASAD